MEELETSRFKSVIIINEKYNIVWRLIKLNVINLFLFSIHYKTTKFKFITDPVYRFDETSSRK